MNCKDSRPVAGTFLAVALLFAGCMKETGETVVLPVRAFKVPEYVLSAAERAVIEEWMPINEGDRPPAVEGCYLASPLRLLYSSDGLEPEFHDLAFCLGVANGRGRTTYRHRQGVVEGTGLEASIVGSGDRFTLWVVEQAASASSGWDYETLTILSGRKTQRGIADCRLAVIMRLRRADCLGALAREGTWRVFADGDGLAQKTEEWQ